MKKSLLDLQIADIIRDAYNDLPEGERSQQEYVDRAVALLIEGGVDLNAFRQEIVGKAVQKDIADRAKVIFKIEKGVIDLQSLFPREEAEALVIRLGDGHHVRLIDATYDVLKYREGQQKEAADKAKLAHLGTVTFWEITSVGKALIADHALTFGTAMIEQGEWDS